MQINVLSEIPTSFQRHLLAMLQDDTSGWRAGADDTSLEYGHFGGNQPWVEFRGANLKRKANGDIEGSVSSILVHHPDASSLAVRVIGIAINDINNLVSTAEAVPGGADPDYASVGYHAYLDVFGLGPVLQYGGDGNDLLEGNGDNDVMFGRKGNDTFILYRGDDLFDGGAGLKDAVSARDLEQGIIARLQNGAIKIGGDTVSVANIEQVRGSSFADRIIGDLMDNRLEGFAGADYIAGGDGDDYIHGGTGFDELSGGGGDDRLLGSAGDDIIEGNGGADTLLGGKGDDRQFGGSENDLLRGQSGDDRLLGQAGADQLFGGRDNDFLFGGAGDDELKGQRGDDRIEGGAGDDLMAGGPGADRFVFDTADGDLGDDRISDYRSGVDIIALLSDDPNLVTVEIVGADTLITYAGGTITLENQMLGAGDVTFEF